EPEQWPVIKSLDHFARDRQRRGVQSDSRDGRLGARIPARLQTSRKAEIHRGVFLEHRLGRSRETPEETHGRANGSRLDSVDGFTFAAKAALSACSQPSASAEN